MSRNERYATVKGVAAGVGLCALVGLGVNQYQANETMHTTQAHTETVLSDIDKAAEHDGFTLRAAEWFSTTPGFGTVTIDLGKCSVAGVRVEVVPATYTDTTVQDVTTYTIGNSAPFDNLADLTAEFKNHNQPSAHQNICANLEAIKPRVPGLTLN